ncbi:MAG: hypothetical protein ACLPUO_00925 [Streptosporangiaceae bacterium]
MLSFLPGKVKRADAARRREGGFFGKLSMPSRKNPAIARTMSDAEVDQVALHGLKPGGHTASRNCGQFDALSDDAQARMA